MALQINTDLNELYKRLNINYEDENEAYKKVKELADNGDAEIQAILALQGMHEDDDFNVTKEKYDYAKKSADQNSPYGQFALGYIELNDINNFLLGSYDKSLEYLKKASDSDVVNAQRILGLYYRSNPLGEIDLDQSFHYIKLAADNGDAPSQYDLALLYLDGVGTEKDERKYFEYLSKSAEQGYSNALCKLGLIYDEGHDYCPRDLKKAVEYLTLAADKNNSEAQYCLGDILCDDSDDNEFYNFEKGLSYMEKAMNNHNEDACIWLSDYYLEEDTDHYNPKKAFNLIDDSADYCSSYVLFRLGELYHYGIGTKKDKRKAFKYYKLSADNECERGALYTGISYMSGFGTKQSIPNAIKYFEMVSNGEFDTDFCIGEANYNLGIIYIYKSFGYRDLDKARLYLSMSAEDGFKDAKDALIYLNNGEDLVRLGYEEFM